MLSFTLKKNDAAIAENTIFKNLLLWPSLDSMKNVT